ncbi:MAG: hypothetical protein ABWZ67_10135 [Solirubrobacteraceae bacterium]
MSLAVEASVGPDARGPTTIPVHVRIRNDGEAPVRVARRLAVGYRDADGRELFAEVHPPGSDELVSRQTKLYDRDPAKPEEYVPLAPGEELATDFDLIRWYALPGPGSYELQVFYEGDGMLAPQVDGAARGIYASGRVPFDLPEETWGA